MNPAHGGDSEARGGPGLHACPECSSTLVQPVRWQQTAKRGHWRLWRRCPNCGWCCESVHGEAEIEAYEDALEIGAEVLRNQLEDRKRESFEAIQAPFSAALAADLITADDFRPRH